MNERTLWMVALVLIGLACSPSTPQCNADSCAGCCDASGKCMTGIENNACGRNGETCSVCSTSCSLGSCTNTGGGAGTTGGGGGPTGGGALAVPPGNTCTTAVVLDSASHSWTVTNSLNTATNDRDNTCLPGAGLDVVYAVTVSGGEHITATVTPLHDWQPALGLFAGDTCLTASETLCNAATASGQNASLTSGALDAGTWYLWVDSAASPYPSDFTLNVTVSP